MDKCGRMNVEKLKRGKNTEMDQLSKRARNLVSRGENVNPLKPVKIRSSRK